MIPVTSTILPTATTMGHLHSTRGKLFSKALTVLQEMAPLELAASWDNVGLLLDTPAICNPPMQKKNFVDGCDGQANGSLKPLTKDLRVLVTNDLTETVVQEAVMNNVNFVITYHPSPFGKTNKIVRNTHINRVVLTCIYNGIAVYSPHTAYDCAKDGVNDWLFKSLMPEINPASDLGSTYFPIEGHKLDPKTLGYGRWGNLKSPKTVEEIIQQVKTYCGVPTLRRADGFTENGGAESGKIATVGVCAGSGGSCLKHYMEKMKKGEVPQMDLFLTGEMSHHDALEAIQNGVTILLTEHTNSERGFLKEVADRFKTKMGCDSVEVMVSKVDRDPLYVV